MTRDLHQLAGAYALDALDDRERSEFERHLADCLGCTEEVAGFQATAADLGRVIAVPPPAGLRDRVLDEVSRTRQVAPAVDGTVVDLRRRRRPLLVAGLAAAAVVVIGLVGLVGLVVDRTDPIDEVLAASDTVDVDLAPVGPPVAEAARLRIAWLPSTGQAAVIGDGLTHPGPGMAYEVWYLRSDETVARAALFTPEDGSIRTLIDLDDPGAGPETVGWGVTIEPAAGSDQPTSDVLFSGTF